MVTVTAALVVIAVLLLGRDARAATSVFVGPRADTVVDAAGRWTIDDMTNPAGAARFAKADGRRAANYGATNGPNAAMWLRLVVPPELETDGGVIVLTIRESRIRTLEVYRPREGGYDIMSWRLGVTDNHARLATRYPAVALPASARGQTIYLRFHTPSSMRASVWVQNEASYLRTYSAEMMFFGVLFGVLVALLIYFAAAAIGSRDPATGALAVLVLSFACHILGDQAFLETYVYPGAVNLSRVISIGATFVIYTASLFYAVRSLHVSEQFPRLARLLELGVWILATITVAAVVATAAGLPTLRHLSPVIGLTTIGTVMSLAVLTAVRQPGRSIVFLLCWGPAQLTGIARLMPDFFAQDGFNPILINLMYPAFALSLLLAGIAAASDVRERQKTLTRIATENAERLRAFAQSASDSFWETDRTGCIVFATGPASALAGLAVGSSVKDVLAQDAGVHLRPGEGTSRAPLVRGEGEAVRHLRLSAVPIEEGGWRGIVSDVTDEVMEAERTNQQRRMAAIGQMAGGVAHEINNLLHPMINLSRRAGESLAESDERKVWLEIVRSSGLRAAEIVAALLSSVRPIPGDGRRAPMGAAIGDIVAEVRALVPAATTLSTQVETDEGPVLPVAEVFQVVANLVINAVHATSGGVVSVSYARAAGAVGELFELAVDDDGIGMDEATLRRASEPFFTTKPQGEGTGLGLSIVQGLASKWGGELKIVSEPGKGTRVTVLVPMNAFVLNEEERREGTGG
jgi:signal transduction histidine kinase